ncbi:hypothetical protein WOLCODRAFT_18531 [Wolfiporia cocos MD-104 SS10]|uniref:Uncharacterized protein n=1 Tax=Wolfiporia cocos (strain MD-104) TaxID=742152 RepID=A0A2H3K0V7_WOLCO|nr:hypothetical protein WOLCODRAFT_18531 [Wolfiporia cocos MD-104 SS10]
MSANSSHFEFPAPIGGVPFPLDFGPAVFFAVIYAICVPLVLFRLALPSSRTFVILGTMIFTVERIVDFALRAEEAHSPSKRVSKYFVSYLQTAYAAGFIGIGQDLVVLARAFLVNSTHGDDSAHSAGSSRVDVGSRDLEDAQPLTGWPYVRFPRARADEPRRRFWTRRACGAMSLLYWAAVILATVSGATYFAGIASASQAQLTQQTRYAATVLTLVLLQATNWLVLWSLMTCPYRIARVPALVLCLVANLLTVTSVYRLAAMHHQTTALLSTAPGSLNSAPAKAVFYALHIAPEWLAGAVLLGVNVRKMFDTGLMGDWRSREVSKN